MHGRDHQKARKRRLVGKRKQLATAANPHCPAAQQEERNVAAELLRQAAQLRQFHPAPRQHRQRQQHRRGIRRSAAQPSAHGNAFVDTHLDAPGDAHSRKRHAGRARRQVIGNAEAVLDLDGDLPPGREGDVDGIRERNGLKDSPQLMVPIGPETEHAEVEINLRERAHPQKPGDRRNVSRFSRTSAMHGCRLDSPFHRLAGLDAVRLPPNRERSTALAMAW